MPHSNPTTVELTHPYNKVIRKGKSNQKYSTEIASRDRGVFYDIDGFRLDKPIQIYRMWYRFLQLAIELEEKEVSIITRMESVELDKPIKDQWGKIRYSKMVPVTLKVEIARRLYADWDIDRISNIDFDSWWKGNSDKEIKPHRHLFYPDTSVEIMSDKNDWIDAPHFKYVKVDMRRRKNDISADFTTQLSNMPRMPDVESDFQVTGTPNINTLINRYNALIIQLTTILKDKEILNSSIFRVTQEGMGDKSAKRIAAEDSIEGAYTYSGSAGRAMRDLILPAKITLLSVCDGHFVKNPHNDYLCSD